METGTDLKQGAYTTMGTDSAGSRTGDAGKEFEECRLSGAVLAYNADDIALLDFKIDIFESPNNIVLD